MSKRKREYMAYLLRLWRENDDRPWRALLENPNTKERFGFANLNELIEFLEDKTGVAIVLPPPEEVKHKIL